MKNQYPWLTGCFLKYWAAGYNCIILWGRVVGDPGCFFHISPCWVKIMFYKKIRFLSCVEVISKTNILFLKRSLCRKLLLRFIKYDLVHLFCISLQVYSSKGCIIHIFISCFWNMLIVD